MQPNLEAKLELLVAKDEIRDVLYRYCRGADRVDLELMISCYWPEARDNHGFYVGNAHEFCRYVIPILGQVQSTTHSLTNSLIEVDGDRAFAESYVRAVHRLAKKDGSWVDDDQRGRYLDVLERRSGIWKILHRVYVPDASVDEPIKLLADPAAMMPLMRHAQLGMHGPSDPSYRRFDIAELHKGEFRVPDLWKVLLGDH